MPSPEFPPEWEEMIRRARAAVTPSVLATARSARKLASSPDFIRWTETAREASEQARRLFTSPAYTEGLGRQLREAISKNAPALRELARQWHRLWEEAIPPNWAGLEPDEIMHVLDRVGETGYCLVWVPRVELVRAIIGHAPSSAAGILLGHREDVLRDLGATLADVDHPDLQEHRKAAEEAVRVFRGGDFRAAQALANCVLTSELHVWFEMKMSAATKRVTAANPTDAPIQELRLHTIYLALNKALDRFYPAAPAADFSRFNRHNTAHRITRKQWTEANALSALLLAVSFLRELNYWFHLGVRG
jgi:hypothetical protein